MNTYTSINIHTPIGLWMQTYTPHPHPSEVHPLHFSLLSATRGVLSLIDLKNIWNYLLIFHIKQVNDFIKLFFPLYYIEIFLHNEKQELWSITFNTWYFVSCCPMNDNLIANHFGNNAEKKVYLHLENKMAFGYQESRSTNEMFPNPKPHCLHFWEGVLTRRDL